MQNGYVTPQRTTLIASTNRVFADQREGRHGGRPLRRRRHRVRRPRSWRSGPSCSTWRRPRAAAGSADQRGPVRRARRLAARCRSPRRVPRRRSGSAGKARRSQPARLRGRLRGAQRRADARRRCPPQARTVRATLGRDRRARSFPPQRTRSSSTAIERLIDYQGAALRRRCICSGSRRSRARRARRAARLQPDHETARLPGAVDELRGRDPRRRPQDAAPSASRACARRCGRDDQRHRRTSSSSSSPASTNCARSCRRASAGALLGLRAEARAGRSPQCRPAHPLDQRLRVPAAADAGAA